jgi:cytochrome c oxidase subunit 4
MTEKSIPISTYAAVFLALLILTATTCGVSYVNLGRLNTVVALTIAVIKASLVLLYFMHLRYSTGLNKLVGVAALFWLGIMILLTISDYLTRRVS